MHDSYTSPPNYPIFNNDQKEKAKPKDKSSAGIAQLTGALTDAIKSLADCTKGRHDETNPGTTEVST